MYEEPRFTWSPEIPWADAIVDGLPLWLREGYAFRVSSVGYGIALRVSLSDVNGNVAGWTVTTTEELLRLLRGLSADGWQDAVHKRLERPSRRRSR